MVRIVRRQFELRLIDPRHCFPGLRPARTLVALEKCKLREKWLSCWTRTPVTAIERLGSDEVVVRLRRCHRLFRQYRVVTSFAKTIGQQPRALRQRLLIEGT